MDWGKPGWPLLVATAMMTVMATSGGASANMAQHSLNSGNAARIIPAQMGSCDDLWTERNEIYKGAGYCFRTRRAISTFGNAGCQYDNEADVPLSHSQRQRIGAIRATERDLGCTP